MNIEPSRVLAPPRFEDGKTMLIAGLSRRYSYKDMEEAFTGIPAQWQRIAPQLDRIPGRIGNISYGVCCNIIPGDGFRYLCGAEVADKFVLPNGFDTERLPAKRYAVFNHADHISQIRNTIDAIWNKWLPQSEYEPAGDFFIEHYGKSFDPQTGMGGVDILVPVERHS